MSREFLCFLLAMSGGGVIGANVCLTIGWWMIFPIGLLAIGSALGVMRFDQREFSRRLYESRNY